MKANQKTIPQRNASDTERGATVTKAVIRAADLLGITGAVLAKTIGSSPSSVTRMRKGEMMLSPGNKDYELAVLFIRMFRSLDAIAGGDEETAKSWMHGDNLMLRGCPVETIQTVQGLVNATTYLDARRSSVALNINRL
jgi:hypothetical protein